MTGTPLSPAQRVDWLRLIRTDNVGPITFRQLLARFGDATNALAALPDLSRRGGRSRPLKPYAKSAAEHEIEELAALDGRIFCWGEPDYPSPLAAVEDAPPVIMVRGFSHVFEKRCLAIVGARNASLNGRKMAQTLAHELGEAGFVIASGMARGIDASAHAGSLASGTIAVLAGGVDVIYPQENEQLYADICGQGAVISERPVGVVAQARDFPRRNRIIAGLALGVVVVEAAHRSGSLITARLALEQGREVFAVPGSPLDPRCRGTNHLLRQGAVLTESARDVVDAVTPMLRQPLAQQADEREYEPPRAEPVDENQLADARETVLRALSPTPVDVDEIVRTYQLSPAVVWMVLLELELAWRIERQPGNRVAAI